MTIHKILWTQNIRWWTQYMYGRQNKCMMDKNHWMVDKVHI